MYLICGTVLLGCHCHFDKKNKEEIEVLSNLEMETVSRKSGSTGEDVTLPITGKGQLSNQWLAVVAVPLLERVNS